MPRKVRQVFTNFSAGELNPLLNARTDAKAYFEGARQCKNWYLLDEGGVMRRPATQFTAELPAESRVIPFVFSEDETALFVLSNNRLDVYNSSGVAIASNITTNCNWTTAQLFELNYAQFGDTVFVANRNNPIIQIKRNGATSFAVNLFAFEEDDTVTVNSINKTTQPFYKYEPSTVTLTPSATTGNSVTITASVNTFVSAHNGTYLQIGGKQLKIVGFTNATTVTATVLETLANTDANADWQEQLFSAVRGFPQAVSFHDNRLFFAGGKDAPSVVVASQIGGYFNFSLGTGLPNESINVSITSDSVNEIRHLLSGRNLQIFTDAGEFFVPQTADQAITPATIAFLRQTPYGCNRANPVPFDGATIFTSKNGKSIREYVYSDLEQAYKSNSISILSSQVVNKPKQLTMMTGNEERPEQFAYFLNSGSTLDGQIAVFHSIRDEKVAGWTIWNTKTNDKFHSITSINEFLFVITKRILPSGTKYLLEKFSNDDSITVDCSTLTTVFQKGSPVVKGASQSGATLLIDGITSAPKILETFTIAGNATVYTIQAVTNTASNEYSLQLDQNLAASPSDNAVITIVKGFTHTVNSIYEPTNIVEAVFGNGALGNYTIDANSRITLINAPQPTGVRVGYNFTPILETMPIDKEIDTGPLTGQPRRINKAIIDISGGLDVTMKASDIGAKELVIQQSNFTLGSDLSAETGKKEFNFLGYSKSPTITISQNEPLPLKVLGLAMEIQFA
tara:strand:+ start:5622 stop:7835 length:2214 start_codon:yes stop_codon:yes gene_type:complete